MTEPFTPTEKNVLHRYIDSAMGAGLELTTTDCEQEFDRFLARVRRDAWNEGAQAQADTYGGQIDTGPNPYEESP